MVISRSGQRRRRVVIDEVVNNRDEKTVASARLNSSPSPAKKAKKKVGDSRLYSFGADRRGQYKTTDFIPKRFLSFACVVLGLVACVGVLNLLAHFAPSWQNVIGDAGRRMFSITGVGSLSSWFSSFLLIITGLASLQIYALRQHRCDDYRGTYRLWLWLALLFTLASVHCVVDMGSVLQNVVQSISRQPLEAKGWIVVFLKMVALTILFLRGLFEVKASRGAFAMVLIVWVAYSAATVMQIPAVKNGIVVDFDTVYGNTILFATTMLLVGHITYARFVFMHSNGLFKAKVAIKKVAKAKSGIGQKRKKSGATVENSLTNTTRKKSKSIRAGKTNNKVNKTDSPTRVQAARPPKPLARPPVPKPTPKVPPVPTPSPASNEGRANLEAGDAAQQEILSISTQKNVKMSKAERRRQRKLEKRQRRAA